MAYNIITTDEMDYVIIYKTVDTNVYILGIFHTLENYAGKMKILWSQFKL